MPEGVVRIVIEIAVIKIRAAIIVRPIRTRRSNIRGRITTSSTHSSRRRAPTTSRSAKWHLRIDLGYS